MARLYDLKRFILNKKPTRTQKSETTNSEYFFFGQKLIRVSDHNNTNYKYAPDNLNIIVPSNSTDFIINFNYTAITLNYMDTKRLIDSYVWGISAVLFPTKIETPSNILELNALKSEIGELSSGICSIKDKWNAISATYNKEIAAANTCAVLNDKLSTKNQLLKKEIKDAMELIDRLTKQVGELSTDNSALASNICDLKEEILILTEMNENLKAKHMSLIGILSKD